MGNKRVYGKQVEFVEEEFVVFQYYMYFSVL